MFFDDRGEFGILREETVSRMDRVGVGDNSDTFISETHMHRVFVSRRMHGDSLDTHFLASAMNP